MLVFSSRKGGFLNLLECKSAGFVFGRYFSWCVVSLASYYTVSHGYIMSQLDLGFRSQGRKQSGVTEVTVYVLMDDNKH